MSTTPDPSPAREGIKGPVPAWGSTASPSAFSHLLAALLFLPLSPRSHQPPCLASALRGTRAELASVLLLPSSQMPAASASARVLQPKVEAAAPPPGTADLVEVSEAGASTALVDARGSPWLEGVVASTDPQVLVLALGSPVGLVVELVVPLGLVVAWGALDSLLSQLGASMKSQSTRAC